MNRSFRRALGVVSGAVVVGALAATPAQAADPAPVQDFLAEQLTTLDGAAPTTLMVHGTDIAAARAAVDATGMRTITEFERIGVVVATGTAGQIQAARTQPGVGLPGGRRPRRVPRPDLQPRHPRRRGGADADRRERPAPGRQWRLGGGHRLRRRPDAPGVPG